MDIKDVIRSVADQVKFKRGEKIELDGHLKAGRINAAKSLITKRIAPEQNGLLIALANAV